MCLFIWSYMLPDDAKVFLHWGHSKGFVPEWILWWTMRFEMQVNSLLQGTMLPIGSIFAPTSASMLVSCEVAVFYSDKGTVEVLKYFNSWAACFLVHLDLDFSTKHLQTNCLFLNYRDMWLVFWWNFLTYPNLTKFLEWRDFLDM